MTSSLALFIVSVVPSHCDPQHGHTVTEVVAIVANDVIGVSVENPGLVLLKHQKNNDLLVAYPLQKL